jgi:hypothetical protein
MSQNVDIVDTLKNCYLCKYLILVGDVRFELTASGSGDQRSIQLS